MFCVSVVYKHSSKFCMLHYAVIIENTSVRKCEVVGLCVLFKLCVVRSLFQKDSGNDDYDNDISDTYRSL